MMLTQPSETYRTVDANATTRLGAALSSALRAGDTVLLYGDLGTGKSVLARGIARGLDIAGSMPSPTFTLMQPYEGRLKLYHFDLYRLSDEDELYAAGLDEFIGGDGVAVVEWPERAAFDPVPCVCLFLEREADEDARRIGVGYVMPEARQEEIRRALRPWRVNS